jgi:hypothetical protein
MGKAVAYLVIVTFFGVVLGSSGRFDWMFATNNLNERSKFWREVVSHEAPQGTSRSTVDALMARYGISLECFDSSGRPPISKCLAYDSTAKGGTANYPLTLQLIFTFHGNELQEFESGTVAVKEG